MAAVKASADAEALENVASVLNVGDLVGKLMAIERKIVVECINSPAQLQNWENLKLDHSLH